MAEIRMTFGKVEALLSTYFRIDPDRAGTFRARLKQLQRLNFPQGVNVGRGTRFEYETEHVIKLTFAFELLAVGLPAKLVTEIVEKGWERIAVAVQLVVGDWIGAPYPEEDVYCIFAPDLLIDSSSLSEATLVYEKEAFMDAASNDGFTPAAILSINVTKLMRRLYLHFDHIRIRKNSVAGEVRTWDTVLPTLHDDWSHDWIKVSFTRLEQYKPRPQLLDEAPF